jgi:hypothetical protein
MSFPALAGLSWRKVSEELSKYMASDRQEWCGVPIPVDDLRLIVEEKNPWRPAIEAMEAAVNTVEKIATVCKNEALFHVVNGWYSTRLHCEVFIIEEEGTRHRRYILGPTAVDFKSYALFHTIGVSDVWSVDAEYQAQVKLRTLIPDFAFARYLLTGLYLETSKRSKVTYLFRRSRPTLVLSNHNNPLTTKITCIGSLCLHPLAYYERTWAGSMTPTDDLIAHLLLMRGDEHLFWRRANQHPVYSALSGL